jgi:glycosyltransferase involved in cell wall biosynthesis
MRDILRRLRDDGWPVAISCFFGLQGNPIEWEGIKCYPQMADPFGTDAMFHHANDFKANVVIPMLDIHTQDPAFLSQIQTLVPYVPIDKEPIPTVILDKLRYAYRIVTFSKFGQKALEKVGYTSTLIVEGTDTNIFKPMDKLEVRKELGLPLDAFLFGSIAANKENPPRKGFQEMLEAFKLFYENHKEAALFFHTQQVALGNFPILEYAKYLGFANRIFFLDQYKSTFLSGSDQICKELNSFDVNLHPSQTEGFGLGIIESQACGIPPIINRCTSMPELVIEGKTGEICETDKAWWTSGGGYFHSADVNSLHEKMELLYNKLHKPNTIAKDARKWVVDNYNIDTIFKNDWIKFLEELQEELTLTDKNTNIKKS